MSPSTTTPQAGSHFLVIKFKLCSRYFVKFLFYQSPTTWEASNAPPCGHVRLLNAAR
jgi:hypothetical protein